MDFQLFKAVSRCSRPICVWLGQALDKFDSIVYSLTDLKLPKDPNKPDIVELESRILYSASPFMMWDGEPVAEPLGEFECPPHLSQEYWDSFLLELAPSSTSESLLKITDAIKAARGLDVKDSVDTSNSFDADSADVDDVNETCDGMDDVDTEIETSLETKFEQIEQLLAGLIDPEDTRIVLHGTDGTDRLGTEWLFYGNGQNANVDLQHWGMKLDCNGSPLIYDCDISTRDRNDTILEFISAAVAKHADRLRQQHDSRYRSSIGFLPATNSVRVTIRIQARPTFLAMRVQACW